MSDVPAPPGSEPSGPELTGDERLAAELSLGLLDGDELASARRRRREGEPAFSAMVAAWDERLAPFVDEFAPVMPDAGLWDRIRAAIEMPAEVIPIERALRRKTALWRAYSAAITAIAAALLLAIGLDRNRGAPIATAPATPPVETATAPTRTFVATLASAEGPTTLVVSFDAGAPSLLVTPAVLRSQAGRDYQLWVIPQGSTPRSLGLIQGRGAQRVAVEAGLFPTLAEDATLAVSEEPTGGSTTGQPTGPVIASGPLRRV